MKRFLSIIFIVSFLIGGELFSQTFYYGIRTGFSLARADETTPKLGLQVGGLLEYVTKHNLAFGTEVNLNTQKGMPIEWALQIKYFFNTDVMGLKPYIDIGGDLWFFTGGPYAGARIGAGMDMQLSRNFVIPLDFQFGQVFIGDDRASYFAGTTGIKFFF
ncbi:MAG: hypothetical protein GXO85_16350 [Chlorobi bacterium]|nr:hypothetical protein [Chlorobiota bacterium]